jgi:hypothetical protein
MGKTIADVAHALGRGRLAFVTKRNSTMTRFKQFLATLGAGATLSAPALATDADGSITLLASSAPHASEPSRPRDDGPPLLFGNPLEVGGYGSIDVAYSRMFGEDGALVGLQGALLLDHRLSLGLAGYGWTNSQAAPRDEFGNPQRFETGYGGATIRYSLYMDDLPVYLTVGALVGGGAIALVNDDDDDGDFDEVDEGDHDVFAVVQPDVTLHANLTRWLRLGVTAGYRWSSGVDRNGYQESDVNGFLVGGQVQFGRF